LAPLACALESRQTARMSDTSKPLAGQIALVTGASRGIGYQVALKLGAMGAHVVALARTAGGLEELDDAIRAAGGEAATLVPLDLSDHDALDRLGLAIHERWGKLDILVANAARLGPLSPLGHVTPKEFTKTIDLNVTSQWRLVRSLDPLLKQAPAGRAVFVTSGAGRNIMPYWGPYAISKAAVDALAFTYAAECEGTRVKVNLFSPGPTRTAMRAQAMPGEDPNTLPTAEDIAGKLIPLCLASQDRSGGTFSARLNAWI
jgi:NAD(P)-dependent dehydrogenase (short-subunit alcohol dehydrogenase family)